MYISIVFAYGRLNFPYFSHSEPLATLHKVPGVFIVNVKTVNVMQDHLRS